MNTFKKRKSIANSQYYFNFTATNGKIIIVSEYYFTSQGCDNGISAVRYYGSYEAYYQRFIDSKGEYRFNIVASNGKPVASSSEGYTTYAGRENAIDLLKRHVSTAPVEDLTW